MFRRFLSRRPTMKRRTRLHVRSLEDRTLPSVTVTVNASQTVRPVNAYVLGVNVNWWDTNLNTSQTQQMVQAAGLTIFRFPGGSSSDDNWHFNNAPAYNGQGVSSTMASFISSVNGQGVVTLDYGSGSPQEAAAFLAYLNGSPSDTTNIGMGEEWNNSTNTWVQINWQTGGYWASLRAAAPLQQDDGLNFLRLNRSASFGFHYFEVGNEEYGSWEVDHHGSGGDTGQPHDPATYVSFAKTFAGYAAKIDPGISIGFDVGSVSTYYNNWTANILQQAASQGFTPGFLSDHSYMQAPGSESDSTLLLDTVSDPNNQDSNSPFDWALRAQGYRNDLNQYLGSAASGVELLATEYNSVYSNPGKQTTSLVNGLFVADSIGSLLQTEYNAGIVWDLRNGWDTSNNNSSSLYGWRQGGDYGLLGSPNGSPPSSGTYVPYPTYLAEQLASEMIHTGDTVVQATSQSTSLAVYAVEEQSDGHLDLLVINKSPSSSQTGTFQISGFHPWTQAQVWQYGETQDTAQSKTSDGSSALASSTATLKLSGSNFSYSFPAYSMTVLDITPHLPPAVVNAAAANPNPVSGTSTSLSALGNDQDGESTLKYTWKATGPASVKFSTNGTNAAKNVTATFYKSGAYTFTVTITNDIGLTTTSSVAATVNQTLTSIRLSPATLTLAPNATRTFTASARDQFGYVMAIQPTFTWSVANGGGTITSSGKYTAPSSPGSATVEAASGSIDGTAAVTIEQLPAQPTNFTANPVSSSEIDLSWTEPGTGGPVSGFYLYVSLDNKTWQRIAVLGASAMTFDDTGLLTNTQYYFRICAYNGAGLSPFAYASAKTA